MSNPIRISMIVFVLIVLALPGFTKEQDSTEYLVYLAHYENGGQFIAYSNDDEISSDWDNISLPAEPLEVTFFSISGFVRFNCQISDFYIPGDEGITWPANAYMYRKVEGFTPRREYPHFILGWTGNTSAIKTLDLKHDREKYAELAEDYFRDDLSKEDLAVYPDEITEIWRVDLDRDGIEEAIYGAISADMENRDDRIYGSPEKGIWMNYNSGSGFSVLLIRSLTDKGDVLTTPIY